MVRRTDLSDLSERRLLESLGVRGSPRLIAAAAAAAGGHALTLNLLGSYVAGVHGGVIEEARAAIDELMQHGTPSGHDRAARMMEGYVRRFEALADDTAAVGGVPELALLHLVGLFDRPAEKDAIDVVKAAGLAPPLAPLTTMTPMRWATAVSRLRAQRLLLPRDPTRPHDLDAHPMVRAHFGARLKRTAPEVFRAAHLALYDHYRMLGLPEAFRTQAGYAVLAAAAASPDNAEPLKALERGELPQDPPPGLHGAAPERLREAARLMGTADFGDALARCRPDDLAGMAPLFAAIAHGAAADKHEAALREVLWPRIHRGSDAFIVRRLGATSRDLAALAYFFEIPWSMPASGLSEREQMFVVSEAAFALGALGRTRDAAEASAAAIERLKRLDDHLGVAWANLRLSDQRLVLGHIPSALAAAREGMAYADRAGDAFARIVSRTAVAHALLQAGDLAGSEALFREAEEQQAQYQPQFPQLYSQGGFRYCELLLERGRAGEAEQRCAYFAGLRRQDQSLLDLAQEERCAGGQRTPWPGSGSAGPPPVLAPTSDRFARLWMRRPTACAGPAWSRSFRRGSWHAQPLSGTWERLRARSGI
jgi:hypothetical protein